VEAWLIRETAGVGSLLIAIVLSGAIGLEREFRGRPAGLRTHILVCLGATLIMIASQRMALVSQDLPAPLRVTVDPGRIAAGIVTGIGFLGAGAILRIGDLVRGLTTAGTIWLVAALGIAVGQGLYVVAVVSTLLVLAVLLLLTRVESLVHPVVYRSITVLAPLARAEGIERRLRAFLAEHDIRVQDVVERLSAAEGTAEVTVRISVRQRLQSGEVLRAIAGMDGVMEARWY
jgi:putative Mg2+ transporter-C (MgtC) family protein